MHKNIPIKNVIDGGYCIGCGGCASIDKKVTMEFNSVGLPQPYGNISIPEKVSEVCPFGASNDEDDLGAKIFGSEVEYYDSRIGYYQSVYVGHVADNRFRERGGSSGFVTWVLSELLEKKLVDGVIHVKPSDDNKSLFNYGISRTVEEVLDAAKSKYHPAHFDEAVNTIKGDGKRYAFVGVPCFVKSIRLLADQDEILGSQIKYCIALFCGHMKTSEYTNFISNQLNVSRQELTSIDFRVKDSKAPANLYKCAVEGKKGGKNVRRTLTSSRLYGMDWGLGYFKPKACDWCDDIVGELADVSSGDAWLPEYVKDSGGNNVIVIRSKVLKTLVDQGRLASVLKFDEKTPDDVYVSQSGNYRHRREGLSVRMQDADQNGNWHPRKRVNPDDYFVTNDRKELYRHRERLSESSHHVFQKVGRMPLVFAIYMVPAELKYYKINKKIFRGTVKLGLQISHLAIRLLKFKVFK